ncbi:hypothetical protein MMC09_003688 [Bachmanniomyces sp. S44760]|nr:hypothetical protein [Bachmanniomyces sp. S44760]
MKVLSNLLLLSILNGLGSTAPVTSSASIAPASSSSPPAGSSSSVAPPQLYPLSNDTEFSFQLMVFLAQAEYHGASVGEVLAAALTIEYGKFESFYSSFYGMANRVKAVADLIDVRRFSVSAYEAYFRIATYFRAADFFLHGNVSDPRLYSLWDSQTEAFDKALSLLPIPGKRINIQANGFTVPAIFISPPGSKDDEPRPTILVGSGYDAAQEDSLHSVGFEILDRGWNYISYEGPGQPTVRRDQDLGFIPEWQEVVTPVVDYLATRPDVDMNRLGLMGISFGGSLSPRVAAFEHRFAAIFAIDGMYSIQTAFEQDFPPQLITLYKSGNATAFDATMNKVHLDPATPSNLRWVIDQGLWAFKTDSPYDWFTQLGEYSLFNDDRALLKNITTPVFVGYGQDDTGVPGQGPIVAEALGDLATFYQFNNSLGAGQHCQLGAEPYLAQVSLDWFQNIIEGGK